MKAATATALEEVPKPGKSKAARPALRPPNAIPDVDFPIRAKQDVKVRLGLLLRYLREANGMKATDAAPDKNDYGHLVSELVANYEGQDPAFRLYVEANLAAAMNAQPAEKEA